MKRILSAAAGLALIVFAIGFVASAARADTITQPVGDAGAVTFTTDGGVLAFVGAEPAAGWTYAVDRADDSHLKVTFRDAAGAQVEFEVEFEDGQLAIGGETTTTTLADDGTTTTTIDDSSEGPDDSTLGSDDQGEDQADDQGEDQADDQGGDSHQGSDDGSGHDSGDSSGR